MTKLVDIEKAIKYRFVMSKEGLITYDKDKPVTIRFNRKETEDLFKRKINFDKFDNFCEVAHLEISNNCFVAGTLITLQDREEKIENCKKGDACKIYNNGVSIGNIEGTSKQEYHGDLIEITLINEKIIKVTPDHEIYTTNRGWIKAKEVSLNDELADMQNLSGEIPESI